MSPTAAVPRPRRPRLRLPLLLASVAVTLAACVTVDGTLRADGSGTLEMVYRVPPNSTETLEKRRFASPRVTLESLRIREDGTARVELAFTDPAALSTLEIFRSLAISRERDGDEERLTIVVTNSDGRNVKDEGKPGPRIHVTLPGTVLEANRNAVVEGSSVTWSFGLVEFLRQKTVDLTARYQLPPPATP